MPQLFLLLAALLAATADARPVRRGTTKSPPPAAPSTRSAPPARQPAAQRPPTTQRQQTPVARPPVERPSAPAASRAPVQGAAPGTRPVATAQRPTGTRQDLVQPRVVSGRDAPIASATMQRPVTAVNKPFTGVGPTAPAADRWVARPAVVGVRYYPAARHWAPATWHYRPYYAHWWCHPWYRWTWGTTVVVGFGFPTYAWVDTWYPPARAGWVWVPGSWMYGGWAPGYWSPVSAPPIGYAYVPGWWDEDVYVEGYFRTDARDGWEWEEGYYLDDGAYIPGHWRPLGEGPEGYVWEPGFFDGKETVDGFWRPEFRDGYLWVSSYFEESGLYHAGYWQPTVERPGYVWVPGWFDGNEWIEGEWVTEEAYRTTDPSTWRPEDGWDGKGEPPTPAQPPPAKFREEPPPQPLAIPVPS